MAETTVVHNLNEEFDVYIGREVPEHGLQANGATRLSSRTTATPNAIGSLRCTANGLCSSLN